MLRTLLCALLISALVFSITAQMAPVEKAIVEAQQEYSGGIRVFGLVNTPLDLSDSDLSSLPKVTEVATIQCVLRGAPPDLTVNWTGIPLFQILTIAGVKPEATKVAFRSRPPDDFSSDLPIADALNSTILVATEANGVPLTSLSEIAPNHIGGYRLVVPGRFGYKWVANLASIEVVDYDFKGSYESSGIWSDQALVDPSSWTPEERAYLPAAISPPLQIFPIPYGNRSFAVQAYTNSSVRAFHFDIAERSVFMDLTVQAGDAGFVTAIIQQAMIAGPYQTFIDGNSTTPLMANVSDLVFQYLPLTEGMHSLRIVGTEFLGDVPAIVIAPVVQPVYVGTQVIFDARGSQDAGMIVAFMWNFGDGTSGSGAVVSHAFNTSGAFKLMVTALDNFGGTSSATFDVTVQQRPLGILILVGIGFLIATVIAVLVFAMLIRKRRRKIERASEVTADQGQRVGRGYSDSS